MLPKLCSPLTSAAIVASSTPLFRSPIHAITLNATDSALSSQPVSIIFYLDILRDDYDISILSMDSLEAILALSCDDPDGTTRFAGLAIIDLSRLGTAQIPSSVPSLTHLVTRIASTISAASGPAKLHVTNPSEMTYTFFFNLVSLLHPIPPMPKLASLKDNRTKGIIHLWAAEGRSLLGSLSTSDSPGVQLLPPSSLPSRVQSCECDISELAPCVHGMVAQLAWLIGPIDCYRIPPKPRQRNKLKAKERKRRELGIIDSYLLKEGQRPSSNQYNFPTSSIRALVISQTVENHFDDSILYAYGRLITERLVTPGSLLVMDSLAIGQVGPRGPPTRPRLVLWPMYQTNHWRLIGWIAEKNQYLIYDPLQSGDDGQATAHIRKFLEQLTRYTLTLDAEVLDKLQATDPKTFVLAYPLQTNFDDCGLSVAQAMEVLAREDGFRGLCVTGLCEDGPSPLTRSLCCNHPAKILRIMMVNELWEGKLAKRTVEGGGVLGAELVNIGSRLESLVNDEDLIYASGHDDSIYLASPMLILLALLEADLLDVYTRFRAASVSPSSDPLPRFKSLLSPELEAIYSKCRYDLPQPIDNLETASSLVEQVIEFHDRCANIPERLLVEIKRQLDIALSSDEFVPRPDRTFEGEIEWGVYAARTIDGGGGSRLVDGLDMLLVPLSEESTTLFGTTSVIHSRSRQRNGKTVPCMGLGVARLLNHECFPNGELLDHTKSTDRDEGDEMEVFQFFGRAEDGEELCISYGLDYFDTPSCQCLTRCTRVLL